MLKTLEILLARQDEFIGVIEREGPRPRLDIVQMDIFPACDALGFCTRNAESFLRTRKVELHGALATTKDLYVLKGSCSIFPVIVDKMSGMVSADMYPASLEKAGLMQETCRALFGSGL